MLYCFVQKKKKLVEIEEYPLGWGFVFLRCAYIINIAFIYFIFETNAVNGA